jgi:hypothetical protein
MQKGIEIQEGFCENYSTIDRISILTSLIRKYTRKKDDKFLCALFYLKGVFNSLNKGILMHCLINLGLPHQFVQILIQMYLMEKSVVWVGKEP